MKSNDIFKVFGILLLMFELLMLFLLPFIHRRDPINFDFYTTTRFLIFFSLMTAIGIGLLLGKKWAAIGFSLACAFDGLWLIFGSIFGVPFPFVFINIFIGCAFLLPAFFTVKLWSQLNGRPNFSKGDTER